MTRWHALESWQRQDIIDLYRKGLGAEAVARRLRLPLSRVIQTVRSAGLMRRYGRPKNKVAHMTPSQTAEALRRYALGFSSNEIATRFGVTEYYVRRALHEAGVKPRGPGGSRKSPLVTDEIVERALAMIVDGDTSGTALAQISRALDVPRTPLRYAMKIPKQGRHGKGVPQKYGPIDPLLDMPIGMLPPDHPFAALDQEMARARVQLRHAYDGGLGASSIAACAEA